jgi:protein phosphatase
MFNGVGKTDIGMKRALNQDAIFVDNKAGIWIIADGMGGHNAGEVAAKIVCECLPTKINNTHNNVIQAIQLVHQKLLEYSEQHIEFSGMGSTIIIAVRYEQSLHIFWSGDCRAYLVCEDDCKLLSKDHSIIQQLIDKKIIDEQEALDHPQQHMVTSCLGGRRMQPTIDQITLTLRANEIVLLCSDGLHKELNNTQITSTLKTANSLQAAPEALIRQANLNGGGDNISVVLISQS